MSKVKVAQLCLTFCCPMDYTVHGIFQARMLGWVAVPFTRGSSQIRDRTHFPCIGRQLLTHCATRGVSLIPIRSEFFHFDSRKYGHQIHRIDLVIRPRKTENSKACSGQRDNKKLYVLFTEAGEKSFPSDKYFTS